MSDKILTNAVDPFLELVGTVTIPAITTVFVAADRFVVNISHDAPMRISYLSRDFKEWFLGKTEEPVQETTLGYHKLHRLSVDGPIIAELGGEAKAETTLSEMFSLMEKQQKRGEGGVLLDGGLANVFYIRDVSGSLRGVRVRWRYHGWSVRARSVGFPYRWDIARRVFSRHAYT